MMEKQYLDIWTKWVGFLQSDIKIRKEVLESLHLEVRQGFGVIVKSSVEELEHLLARTSFFPTLREELDGSLTYAVWSGYILFLISEGIDPVEKNLIVRMQTNELGNVWMEAFEKDKCESILVTIDPLLSIFLQNTAYSELNQLIAKFSEPTAISYQEAAQIVSFLQWALYQGFILGMLEQKLFAGKEQKDEIA